MSAKDHTECLIMSLSVVSSKLLEMEIVIDRLREEIAELKKNKVVTDVPTADLETVGIQDLSTSDNVVAEPDSSCDPIYLDPFDAINKIGHFNFDTTDAEKLFNVATWGDVDKLREYVSDGLDLNVTDFNGRTPCMVAISRGHDAFVRACLELGADINIKDIGGMTHIMYAVQKNNSPLIRLFVDLGLDINSVCNMGWTATIHAAFGGNDETLRTCVELGGDVNKKNKHGLTPIMIAASRGHDIIIRTCVELGANIHDTDIKGRNLLFYVVNSIDGEVSERTLRTAVELGVDINATDKEGRTLIGLVAMNCKRDILLACVDLGADINVVDSDGMTIAMLADKARNVECVQALNFINSASTFKALNFNCT